MDMPLIPQTTAERAGLTRAWFVQAPLDATRSKMTHLDLQSGLILVVTDEAQLHILDPETGLRQWSFQVGDKRFVAQSAAANDNCVAVANNIRLFLLDRATGNLLFNPLLTGTPASGPVLTQRHVIVPLVTGQLEAYPTDQDFKDQLSPQYLPSAGRLMGKPIAVDNGLVWSGDNSLLNAHQFGLDGPQFNATIPGGVSSGPALFGLQAMVGTETGYVMAFDTRHGDESWRFAAGSVVRHRPIIVNNVAYVLPEDGGMFAVKPETGDTLWYTDDAVQFVAASPQRIYVIDKLKQLGILDAKTGARVDTLRLPPTVKALTNEHTDRILLYTDNGFLQSLHEPQLTQPRVYKLPKVDLHKKSADGQSDGASGGCFPPGQCPFARDELPDAVGHNMARNRFSRRLKLC